MRKVLRTMRWFRSVGLLAQEEQQRAGRPEIDREHLFLALLALGGPVTTGLTDAGITPARARWAFSTLRPGVPAAPAAGPGREGPEPGGRGGDGAGHAGGPFVFAEAARRMLEEAAGREHPDLALLHALREDPDARLTEVFAVLGVDPDALSFPSDDGAHPARRASGRHEYGLFVPAAPTAVWDLLVDPRRWMEWNGWEHERAEVSDAGVVRAFARRRTPDGRDVRLRPGLEVSRYVLAGSEPDSFARWERSFPAAPAAGLHRLQAELAPQGSGTDLLLSYRRDPAPRSGSIRERLARPAVEAVGFRGYLRAKAQAVSHAVR